MIWAPGNHELWTLPSDPVPVRGVARYEALVKVCRRFGVLTPEDEFPVWDGARRPGHGRAAVHPLRLLVRGRRRAGEPQADASRANPATAESEPADPRAAALRAADAAGIVPADEGRLHADPYPSVADWCRDRVAATEARLAAVDGPLVLASHWPLIAAPLGKLRHPAYAPWCGTTLTADWHTRYPVLAAVYGHLHIPRTTEYDGVRFEEVSVGNPREWQPPGRRSPAAARHPRLIADGSQRRLMAARGKAALEDGPWGRSRRRSRGSASLTVKPIAVWNAIDRAFLAAVIARTT